MSFNGRVVPVFSLAHWLADGITEPKPGGPNGTQGMLVALDRQMSCLLVDDVGEQVAFSEDSIQPLANTSPLHAVEGVRGMVEIDGRPMILLEIEQLLSSD